MCGEHDADLTTFGKTDGSSPRVRGTQQDKRQQGHRYRFIPACAGNTSSVKVELQRLAVHPRVCGEHSRFRAGNVAQLGSSPRVRGTPTFAAVFSETIRFIPACAGNTRGNASDRRSSAVHPRVCGEHAERPRRGRETAGSSPRVRGTLDSTGSFSLDLRFIPACAGNTSFRPARSRRPTVHPRVCGEHSSQRQPLKAKGGSSPRVRGTHCHRVGLAGQNRFIPACAGNTTAQGQSPHLEPVHPRVCGEHPAHEGHSG